ncbi:MAG: hypothetical protein LQ351_002297 [Letrouitia transgressa]|nr:MAG: hypothetical protein LQ351_002297 [Letrouitia transgressa]
MAKHRFKKPETLGSSPILMRYDQWNQYVDDGSTVTDFLPAERARGVTIQSAAISFHWPPLPERRDHNPKTQKGGTPLLQPSSEEPHTISLIDTPGHADFTFEVVRSLRILDGAVCILDGVAGVEAQTEKVWYQAAQYKIPTIIYVNKLDRDGAAFGRTVREVASRLFVWPAVCQVPWFKGGNGRFCGAGDVVNLRAFRWPEGGDGKVVETLSLDALSDDEAAFGDEIRKARVALIELLSEHDEKLVQMVLEKDMNHMKISADDITSSLRRCVLNRNANVVPIFAGASFRNIGVQPLLDAIVHLLPNPTEVPDPEVSAGRIEGTLSDLVCGRIVTEALQAPTIPQSRKGLAKRPAMAVMSNFEACALAFKVVHDTRRGALVYIRVYSGSIRKGTSLYNTNLQVFEPAQRLLKMYASNSVDIPYLDAGQIGAIPGLKHARTGDTLISYIGASAKNGPPEPLNTLQLRPIEVPPAVFFSSIESHNLGEEKTVKNALALMIREDPSLQLSEDEESGQTLLSGMGEFHLEIARDRLVNDLKAKATMGKIDISYREAICHPSTLETAFFDREIGGKRARAGCTASVFPISENEHHESTLDDAGFSLLEDGNRISIDPTKQANIHLPYAILHTALKNGVLSALSRGINHGFPICNTHVSISIDPKTQTFDTDSTPAALSSAARLATKAALRNASAAGSAILEHVMRVTISTDEASLGAVVNDISSTRGGHIVSLDDEEAVESTLDCSGSREDLPVPIDLRKVYAPPDPFDPGFLSRGEEADGRLREPTEDDYGEGAAEGDGGVFEAFEEFDEREGDVCHDCRSGY